MSITEILELKKRSDSRIFGVVVGIVTNNKDTEKLGRVKVKIPRISGEDESNWARVISFMAGKERGAFFLPEIDDEVLVAFEYGDINMPYVIGSLWNGKDVPPENNSDGKNNIRVIRSRSGHVITLDDSDGSEQIKIMDKTNKNMIIIDAKNNTISIKSDKDIELLAPNGKVTIEAMDLETKSTASTKIEATSSLDVKASGNLNIKGAMVNIN
ncbi:MAG: phage baseplate assembly protein V [ANME-2 cluster archaeon]|nr:phage baseplate assembly protein V [ANME-2 cluster archaeon]